MTHRARSDYTASSDFVFAGASGRPRWRGIPFADHIKPAALRAGIPSIGWHTFRHSYSTLLHALGAAPAVQKELLRHANIQTTMDIYTRDVTSAKREAASKVVDVLWRM
jgi:integrase